MKLNNEKKEVFKDPFPVSSLADVGRMFNYGVVGGGAGATVGVFGGLGTAIAIGVSGPVLPMIVGGMAVGAAAAAAVGVVLAIKESGFQHLVEKAKEVAKAPGFDKSVLDTPIKGLVVGETFEVVKKPDSHTTEGYLVGGIEGAAIASALSSGAQRDYEKFAANPAHQFNGQIGNWSGEKSLLREGDDQSRDHRPATLRDVLVMKDSLAGKAMLREFIQTGRVDSFARNSLDTGAVVVPESKVDADVASAEHAGNRLAGFMKSTLKTDAPKSAGNAAKPG
jgi:hypothetical protein